MIRQTGPKVAVVGVGSVGAMALWHLARHGVDAVGYDAFAPGHDRGAAGGESRIFRMAYQEGPNYVPLLRRARDLWQQLERETGQQLFHPVGHVTVGPREHPKIETVRASAALHDLPLEELEQAEAYARVPEHPLRDGEVLLLDPLGGLLRPEASVLAAVQLAERLGANVQRYTPVRDVRADSDKAVVVTDDGETTYDRVIIAAGPWAAQQPILQHLPLQPRMVPSMWFPLRNQARFCLERTPVAIRVGNPAYSCFPSVDGTTVKVLPHDRAFTDIDGADSLPRSVDTELVRETSEAVRQTLPDLDPHPTRIATYTDLFALDGHGLLGPIDGAGTVIAATGFSGHGFKLAPALGEVAAALALDKPAGDLSFLDPSRNFH
jgi:sarcosine oxidase